jgi:hypothetical protein
MSTVTVQNGSVTYIKCRFFGEGKARNFVCKTSSFRKLYLQGLQYYILTFLSYII